ncbi:PepSY-like domain-containing protein [Sphingobacterium hungaricum]|uniref:Putative beta-lactamase-inhibitor-like PepSY-like domain-containing protein n=1 Tax=Sphingobacterium hungaricum TaxID=2082723 RepID=A0A928V055_9SPHI|nr:PepSY-like domain-containing protein [Sphingobacterium hungaricum]MBE8714546.1 hypothetical protein [Sphingobacterium hungaricum]
MKNLLLAIPVLFVALFTSCEKESVVSENELPATAKTFISTNFPSAKVLRVEKQTTASSNGTEYSVDLDNRVEIDFDKNGNWTDVDGEDNVSLPTGFILPVIVTYIETNYASTTINAIEKTRVGFEVDLVNGLDLEFNANGEFVRLDP